MQTLRYEDMQWLLRRAPRNLLTLMKEAGPNIVAAGGFVRSVIANEPINDIDLFCPTKELAKQYAEKLSGRFKVIETDNAYTVRNPGRRGFSIQFIHRWVFSKPQACLESFDFTIACAAFWFNNTPINVQPEWRSMCDDRFYADLAAKRLIYRSPIRNEDAGGSMLRVLKFYQRGYRIPVDSLGAVMARMVVAVEMAGSNSSDEKQIAKVLTGLLREVDPNIDPTHVAHLPSSEEATNNG